MQLNGKMPPSERDESVKKFRAAGRDDARVLILSNVGMTGLNLPCANILIMLVCLL